MGNFNVDAGIELFECIKDRSQLSHSLSIILTERRRASSDVLHFLLHHFLRTVDLRFVS